MKLTQHESLIYTPKNVPDNVVTELRSNTNSILTQVPLCTPVDIDYIQRLVKSYKKDLYPVGKQGINTDDGVGSHRLTFFNVELAQQLTREMKKHLTDFDTSHINYGLVLETSKDYPTPHCDNTNKVPSNIVVGEFTSVDAKHGTWEFVGVSPMFRYMEYTNEGEHFPHHDAPHKVNSTLQTLLSGVLYLTTNNTGATIFIRDTDNEFKPFKERNTSDWTRQVNKDDNYIGFNPVKGNCLLFTHQTLHGVTKFVPSKSIKEKRIIIRFDVYYRLVNPS